MPTLGETIRQRYIEHCKAQKDKPSNLISIPEYNLMASPQGFGDYILRIKGHLYFMKTRRHVKDNLIYDFQNTEDLFKKLKEQWITDQYAPECFLCSLMASSLLNYFDRKNLDQLIQDLSEIDPIYSFHIEEQREHFTNNSPLGYKKRTKQPKQSLRS